MTIKQKALRAWYTDAVVKIEMQNDKQSNDNKIGLGNLLGSLGVANIAWYKDEDDN